MRPRGCFSSDFCFLMVLFSVDACVDCKRTAQTLILLIRFLLYNSVSSTFLVLLRYSFWFKKKISTCLMMSASNIPMYLSVSFFPKILISLNLVVLFLSSHVSPFSFRAWNIFLCHIPTLYHQNKSSLRALTFPILFHFWRTVLFRQWTLLFLFLSLSLFFSLKFFFHVSFSWWFFPGVFEFEWQHISLSLQDTSQ